MVSWFIHLYSSFNIFSTPSFKTNHPPVKILLIKLLLSVVKSHDYIWAHSVFWNGISSTDPQEANCFLIYSAAQLGIQLSHSLTTLAMYYSELMPESIQASGLGPRLSLWAEISVLGRNGTIYFQQMQLTALCTVSLSRESKTYNVHIHIEYTRLLLNMTG